MGSPEHTPARPRFQPEPRLDRVREVRRKIARGEYDSDRRALEVTADRILRELVRRRDVR